MLDSIIASEAIRNARLDICKKCEHNKLGVCSKCGCILRLKTQWANVKCPINKWEQDLPS